jgi:hypothetical protein
MSFCWTCSVNWVSGQLNETFPELARCERDWGSKLIIQQYFRNRRKTPRSSRGRNDDNGDADSGDDGEEWGGVAVADAPAGPALDRWSPDAEDSS